MRDRGRRSPSSPAFVRLALLPPHSAAVARPEPGAKNKRRLTRKTRHMSFSSNQTLLGAAGAAPSAPPAPPPRGPPAGTPRSARPALPRRPPPPRRRGGRADGSPAPEAAAAAAASTPCSRGRPGAPRGDGLRCRCTAEGGSRATSGEGGGGALTSRAAARQRARVGGGEGGAVQAAPNPGGTRAEWAGPPRRTGRSIGPGGGASRQAGE